MNRRDFLQALGAAGVVAAVPLTVPAAVLGPVSSVAPSGHLENAVLQVLVNDKWESLLLVQDISMIQRAHLIEVDDSPYRRYAGLPYRRVVLPARGMEAEFNGFVAPDEHDRLRNLCFDNGLSAARFRLKIENGSHFACEGTVSCITFAHNDVLSASIEMRLFVVMLAPCFTVVSQFENGRG